MRAGAAEKQPKITLSATFANDQPRPGSAARRRPESSFLQKQIPVSGRMLDKIANKQLFCQQKWPRASQVAAAESFPKGRSSDRLTPSALLTRDRSREQARLHSLAPSKRNSAGDKSAHLHPSESRLFLEGRHARESQLTNKLKQLKQLGLLYGAAGRNSSRLAAAPARALPPKFLSSDSAAKDRSASRLLAVAEEAQRPQRKSLGALRSGEGQHRRTGESARKSQGPSASRRMILPFGSAHSSLGSNAPAEPRGWDRRVASSLSVASEERRSRLAAPPNTKHLSQAKSPGGEPPSDHSPHSSVAPSRRLPADWPVPDQPLPAHLQSIEENKRGLPHLDAAKVVLKRYGFVEAFVVNTHKGCVRAYNEDRVSILLNAQQKINRSGARSAFLKSCSLFSIFDGHGGNGCCNFLKDKLHNAILEQIDLSVNLVQALKQIFRQLEEEYALAAQRANERHAGSCVVTLLVLNKSILVLNLGDSRAVMSVRGGAEVRELSADHKPDRLSEFTRVIAAGGDLYRMSSSASTGAAETYLVGTFEELKRVSELERTAPDLLFGPWRVKPGGLSVSRSLGDLESKLPQFGGLPGCISAEPDIFDYDLDEADFVLLGCDGVFDRLSSAEVCSIVWQTVGYYQAAHAPLPPQLYERALSDCVNNVLKRAMIAKSEDNITVILVLFKNIFKR